MPTITTDDGQTIHYRLEGEAGRPVLMFSNSLGADLTMWDGNMPAALAHFQVLRYDSRGHGGSSAPAGAYTIDRLGHDALALLDALKIDKVAFCGLSKGGLVAQWLAIHAPERLTRAAICNTGAMIPSAETWNARIAAVTEKGLPAIADAVLERWFTAGFRASHPETVAACKAVMSKVPSQGYAGCCAAVRDADLRADIGRIAVPAIVVVGTEDPATPPALGEAIHAAIKGSRLMRLEAAHLSNIEARAAFDAAVFPFLAG
jgi:3-oxoadipate enol-lactonase